MNTFEQGRISPIEWCDHTARAAVIYLTNGEKFEIAEGFIEDTPQAELVDTLDILGGSVRSVVKGSFSRDNLNLN